MSSSKYLPFLEHKEFSSIPSSIQQLPSSFQQFYNNTKTYIFKEWIPVQEEDIKKKVSWLLEGINETNEYKAAMLLLDKTKGKKIEKEIIELRKVISNDANKAKLRTERLSPNQKKMFIQAFEELFLKAQNLLKIIYNRIEEPCTEQVKTECKTKNREVCQSGSTECGDCVEGYEAGEAGEDNKCYEVCSICDEPMINDFCVTSCLHSFHEKCINEWKKGGNNTCPICRGDISTKCVSF